MVRRTTQRAAAAVPGTDDDGLQQSSGAEEKEINREVGGVTGFIRGGVAEWRAWALEAGRSRLASRPHSLLVTQITSFP